MRRRGVEAMSDPDGAGESTDGSIDRRTVLKGTAAAGVAGAGFAGTASAGEFREVTFCAAGEEAFSYFVRVSGRLKRGGKFASEGTDEVGHDFADGVTSDGGCDSFLLTGKIEQLRLSGPGRVFVDGELVRDTTKPAKPRLPNTITVRAQGETVEYKFRVSGRVAPTETARDGDRVDGNVVRGTVGGESEDTYRYSGAVAFDTADGPLKVTLDIDGQ